MLVITQMYEKPFKERCDTESKDLKYNLSSRENPAIENAEGFDTRSIKNSLSYVSKIEEQAQA